MVSTLARKCSRAIRGRRPDRPALIEDNIANLCLPLVLDTREAHSLSARIDKRSEEVRRVEASIVDLEARLQQLFVQRDRLRTQNSVARAILVSELIGGESIEDDVSILSTDHVPYGIEARNIKARLDVRRQHMNCMEEAIHWGDVDHELKDRLRSRVALLEQSCAVSQALLAPIRRLPAELLGEIFTQAVPSLDLVPLIHDHAQRQYPLYPNEPHPHDVRSRLSQVCSKWDRVARATPQVWKTLALNFPLPSDLSRISRCLKNSKACKLDIYVWIPRWFKPENEALVPQVLRMIREELMRIRVFASQGDSQGYLHSVFPLEIHSRAPLMEIFSIEQFSPQHGDIRLGSIEAPMLHTLELRGANQSLASFVPASLCQLRRLTVGRIPTPAPWAMWLKILSSCPRLEVLHLNLCALDPYEHIARVPLPALQEIVLRSEDPMAFTQIMDSLHYPALTSFTLISFNNPIRPLIADALDSLPDEVAASLCRLQLGGISFTGPLDSRRLQRLTNVEYFTIHDSDLDDIFFNALLPPSSASGPTSWAFPKLRELRLERNDVAGTELLGLIDARTLPDYVERRSHYFNSVVVLVCRGLGHGHIERLHELERTHSETLEFVP